MYMSQEMPNLRRFLARFLLRDNQMTIFFAIFYEKRSKAYIYELIKLHIFPL